MQYKVPQNIDLEDKIVGPFTMKQFVYLLFGGGVIYAWWSFLSKNYKDFTPEFLIIALPVGLLSFSLAIVKINDRPFEIFLANVFRFLLNPKQINWAEGFKEEAVIMLDKEEDKSKTDSQEKSSASLDELAKALDKDSSTLVQQAKVTPAAQPQAQPAQAKPVDNIQLEVNDVASAQENQKVQQKKKGFLGLG